MPLQIGQVVAGRILGLGGFVDGLAGLGEIAILHRLPHGWRPPAARRRRIGFQPVRNTGFQPVVDRVVCRRRFRGGQGVIGRGQKAQEKTDTQAVPAHGDTPLRLFGPHGRAFCLCSLARIAKSPEDARECHALPKIHHRRAKVKQPPRKLLLRELPQHVVILRLVPSLWSNPGDREKSLWLVGRVEQPLGKSDRHDRIAIAVTLEQRTVVTADLRRRVEPVPHQEPHRNQGIVKRLMSAGTKGVFQDQLPAPSAAAKSTATAPPSDSPMSTIWFSATPVFSASHVRAARASASTPASSGLPSLLP